MRAVESGVTVGRWDRRVLRATEVALLATGAWFVLGFVVYGLTHLVSSPALSSHTWTGWVATRVWPSTTSLATAWSGTRYIGYSDSAFGRDDGAFLPLNGVTITESYSSSLGPVDVDWTLAIPQALVVLLTAAAGAWVCWTLAAVVRDGRRGRGPGNHVRRVRLAGALLVLAPLLLLVAQRWIVSPTLSTGGLPSFLPTVLGLGLLTLASLWSPGPRPAPQPGPDAT